MIIGNDIYSAVKTVYILSKIYLTCSFTLKQNLTIVVTKVDIVIIVLQISFFLYFSYDSFFNFFAFRHIRTKFDFGLDGVQFAILYVLIIASLTNFAIHKKTILHLFQNVIELNNLMKSFNFKINYKKYVIQNSVFLSYCIILIIFTTINTIIFDKELPITYFIYINYASIMTSITFCFCGIFFYDIKKRYKGLKLYLNFNKNKNIAILHDHKIVQNDLITIVKIYNKLNTQSYLANSVLYFPLLIMLINILDSSVTYLHGILYQTIISKYQYSKILTISTSYFVYFISVLAFWLSALNNLRKQVNFIYLIIHKKSC